MSNNRAEKWLRFGWHPAEVDLLLFLDGEARARQADKVRAHLEGCWACRSQRDKLDRAIAVFMDYCEAEVMDAASLPPRAALQFAERLRGAAQAEPKPTIFRRCLNSLRWRVEEQRLVAGALASLLLVASLAFIFLRAERPVSAQELLRRSTQAETLSLSRVSEPVVYRKLQVKRLGTGDTVVWESWNDARRNLFRQRIADKQGSRFLRASEREKPAILAELEQIFRLNHFDLQRPLSATAFVEWRKAIRTKSETVSEMKDGLRLSTIAQEPYALNAITEVSLIVRKSDWHLVALQLKVQGEGEIRAYELIETAYEVLPLQALTVFADLAATPPPVPSLTPAPSVKSALALKSADPAPALALPSATALHEAEVAALYELHQLRADLGEQIEVVREADRQIIVRGLVEKAQRKQQLTEALSHLPLVSVQIQTVEEAVQKQTTRNVPAPLMTPPQMIESSTIEGKSPAATNPFQQKLLEQFGGQGNLTEAQRREVNQKVAQFYSVVEAEASSMLAEAWALRRLTERFATASVADLSPAARQRVDEVSSNHLIRLKQYSLSLRTRLEPLLLTLAGATTGTPASSATPQSPALAVFRAVEQFSKLIDRMVDRDGMSAASAQQIAQGLLMELGRLDQALQSSVK